VYVCDTKGSLVVTGADESPNVHVAVLMLVVASEKSEGVPACRAFASNVTVSGGGGAGVGSGTGTGGVGVGGVGTAVGVFTRRCADKIPTVTVIELVLQRNHEVTGGNF